MKITVDCYAGYRGDETPRRIWFGSRPVDITDVMDRWLAPDHRYFKCADADGAVYIIRQDMETLDWALTFYRQG